MKLNLLGEWLSWIEDPCDYSEFDDVVHEAAPCRQFQPSKRLCERDYIIIDMLNSAGQDCVSFCVTDPQLPDNPVIFVSDGFCRLTGYQFDDVVGRNCRFLQGPKTSAGDVQKIKDAIKHEKECSVNLLNYKKDGTTFFNEFYLAQLRSPNQKIAYFIGIQSAVDQQGPMDMPSNPGWCYTLGNHMIELQ